MQRLSDIVEKDLAFIMNTFRDFTEEHTLQCGSEKITVNASLQSDSIQFTSDVSPLNAYSLSCYYIESDNVAFNKSLKKNAIIFIDSVSFRIIDTAISNGLRSLSLERQGGR
jgi:hypothetical protein